MRLHHSLISDIYDIWIFSVYMIEYYQYQKAWINIYDQLQLNYYGLLIWSNLKFWTQIRENNTDKNKLLEKRNENFHCVSWIVCINWLLRNHTHVCGYLRATMSRLYGYLAVVKLWSAFPGRNEPWMKTIRLLTAGSRAGLSTESSAIR